MYCPKCRLKMHELARSFHKKRKFQCPRCGRAKWQGGKELARDRRRKADLGCF